MDELTLDRFAPRVGETFTTCDQQGRPVALTLLTADARPQRAEWLMTRPPFSLIFEADTDLPQAIYALANTAMGDASMCLSPLGPSHATGRFRFQALFN